MPDKKDRQHLVDVFIDKNSQLNLSAIRDADGIFVKHICDALELDKVFMLEKEKSLIDIGTGGGFPLLPIAITHPEINCVGIDSVRKKTIAVNDMIATLGLKNAQVIRTRIEDYKGRSFDYLTARAVAYIDQLLDRSYHLVKKGGYFIFFKQALPEEREVLVQYCKKRHMEIDIEHTYTLFEGDVERVIYVIWKG